tara:strand:+ start:1683 stop:3785 length:2103 start_codon:yes stop_codon:yes gene_type:complete
MFWLRALLFSAPLALVFGAVLLFRQVSRLELSNEVDAMTCVIREPIGALNPLFPLSGTTREVKGLVFEPLLLRDDDLNLRPNIISDWQLRTIVTVHCDSEEAAGDSEAKILSGEYLEEEIELLAVEREGSVLTVVVAGHDSRLQQRLIGRFEPENLGNFQLVQLSLKDSIQESFEMFLKGSVEKSQIQMLDYEGDRIANLFVEGEIDLLLRELQLYYESNSVLEPLIEEVGVRSHTSFREAFVDLREDVRWHDGALLTADDIIFSYEALTGPGSPMPMADSFWFVERIEKINDHRIRMICQDSPSIMMECWEKLPVLPAHLLSKVMDAKEWISFFEMPVGNGPYKIKKRRRDGGIELEAFEGFFRSVPSQKDIVYREVDSLESKLLALKSELIDTIEPDQRFRDWTDRNPGVMRQMRCLPRFQNFVAWNMERSPFDQKKVRTAMAMGIDLNSVLEDTATEFQVVSKSLFFPGMPYSGEPMPLPLFDPRSAERMLGEAGFHYDERKGIRVDSEGDPFAFTLIVNQANRGQVRLADELAYQWSALGVTVSVDEVPWSQVIAGSLANRDFDAVLLSWEVPLERDRYASWHSDGINSGGGNLWGLRNQVVDQLVEKLRYAEKVDEVSVIVSNLENEIADLQPCFFVCDTGRIIWHREGALEIARPRENGETVRAPLGVGKAGLERVRPWWVRVNNEGGASAVEP